MSDTSRNQPPYFRPASGEVRTETPDGVLNSNGFDPQSNLYDDTSRPAIQSGDWQVRPPGVRPRGRP